LRCLAPVDRVEILLPPVDHLGQLPEIRLRESWLLEEVDDIDVLFPTLELVLVDEAEQ